MVRVEQMQNNQFIIREDNRVMFQSYNSIIAIIDYDKLGAKQLTLGKNWNYSNTTARYLNQFLRCFYSWYDVSRAAINKAIKNNDITYDPTLI